MGDSAQQGARMGERQAFDEVMQSQRQFVRAEECTAEKGHGQQNIRIEARHILESLYRHGSVKTDLREDDAVYD